MPVCARLKFLGLAIPPLYESNSPCHSFSYLRYSQDSLGVELLEEMVKEKFPIDAAQLVGMFMESVFYG